MNTTSISKRQMHRVILCAAVLCAVLADKPAPVRVINLDLAPEDRWTAVATEFKEPMLLTVSNVAPELRVLFVTRVVTDGRL